MSEEEDNISINFQSIKEEFVKVFKFFKRKNVLSIILIILFLSMIVGGVWIRTQNLEFLKDQTTGEYIPTALDPFYFLRATEAIIENGGRLPEYDSMRYHPTENTRWTDEVWPYFIIPIHNVVQIFNSEVSIQLMAILFPVIFFVLGLIAFFFLTLMLTKSKTAAFVSSIFLTVVPTYLFRSMTGFYDHEANGTFFFFLAMISFVFALRFLYNSKNKTNENSSIVSKSTSKNKLNSANSLNKILEKLKNPIFISILFGLLVGFLTSFTIVNWRGISNFLFMIFPLAFGIFWVTKVNQEKNNQNKKDSLIFESLIFYVSFFVFTILFGMIFGHSFESILSFSILRSSSILNGFVILFVIVDFFVIKNIKRIPIKNLEKHRLIFSFFVVIILGVVVLSLIGRNPFSLFGEITNRILQPFGTGRVGLTVAENRQPYLSDWISQTGDILFWFFFGGLITIGLSISKGVKGNKRKILFVLFWLFFISGILFSRVSPGSTFDGNTFISKVFYFSGLLVFFFYFLSLLIKEKIKVSPELAIIFSWTLFMLISARGALRLFFVLTPFACFSAGHLFYSVGNYYKKSKEELSKMLLGILLICLFILFAFSVTNLMNNSLFQARNTVPSANLQWQGAMSWVRENTEEDSVFAHWWDYGYWVQYLGQRRTIADGGQFQGSFGNHLIGRYVLTTPNPESALSFLKSNKVTHFLIDPTDIGKYPAYSKIGSDESGNDRYSSIPIMQEDEAQTQIINNSKVRVYQGVTFADEDIIYTDSNNRKILLPQERALVIGVVLQTFESNVSVSFDQPEVVFFYNGQNYRVPLRYVYFNGEIADFNTGLESIAYVLPKLVPSAEGGVRLNLFGSMIYLSKKVSGSLVSQIYLMEDPFDNYPEMELAHLEKDPHIRVFEDYGLTAGDFVYYSGLRGPIKIWEIDHSSDDIIEREEFLERGSGEDRWGEFDNLEFIKK